MLFVVLATLKNCTSRMLLINEKGFDILSQFEVTGTECEHDIFRTSEVVGFLDNELCTLRALHRW